MRKSTDNVHQFSDQYIDRLGKFASNKEAAQGGRSMTVDPRKHSRALLDGSDRVVARALMKAAGFTDDTLSRPQIGIAHCWIGTMPCNLTHRDLAARVAEGITAAGGTPR